MSREMLYRTMTAALALALVLPLLATPALAKNSSGVVKTSITLAVPASLGGMSLKAGRYSVITDGSKVTLKQEGKVVAEAPAQWADAKEKFDASGVVIDGNDIREIRFGGQARYLVIR
jgi:hypothetical protein